MIEAFNATIDRVLCKYGSGAAAKDPFSAVVVFIALVVPCRTSLLASHFVREARLASE